MATPLQWRNIDVPNTGSALSGVVAANNAMRDSFRDIGQLFVDNTKRRRDENTERAIAEAAMAADLDGVAALRGALDPNNRMIDNARVADALNARGGQIRADRSADTEYGIVRDRIDGAPARLLALEHAQRTGDLSQMPGGDAAFEYLDAALNQRTRWQGQENNNRDFAFGERKFAHEQSQDAIRNAMAERQLAEQVRARRSAEARANATDSLYQQGRALAQQLAATGKYTNDEVKALVNRQLGSRVRNSAGAEALNAAVDFNNASLAVSTPEDRLARGSMNGSDAALRAARGYQLAASDRIASSFPGSGLVELSDNLSGKTVPQMMKDAGIDSKDHSAADVTNEVNKVMRDYPGISRSDAMAVVSESIKTRWYGGGTTVDDDLVKAGIDAIRVTRQAGSKEDREREIATGDREVGKMADRLASLDRREQAATAAGADDEVIGQLRQQRQDLATELGALLDSRTPAAKDDKGRPYRGAPEGRRRAPVAAQPFFFQYPAPVR